MGASLTRPSRTILTNGRYVTLRRVGIYIEMDTAPKVILARVGIARAPIRRSCVVVAGIHNHHLNG